MNTSEVLNKAADLIEERGWVRGPGWDWGGDSERPLCLEGAIGVAAGISNASDPRPFNTCPAGRAVRAYLDMEQVAASAGPYGGFAPLYHWNDRAGRTAAEVIEVLRATAVIEAAKEEQAAMIEAERVATS